MNDKRREDTEDYTKKSKKIEELVSADKTNTPQYSKEELDRYKTKAKINFSSTFKALFLKFWFGGVICYFFVWGLGLYIPSSLDLYFVTSLAMGFVLDILENGFFRFYSDANGSNDKWMMFPKKGYISLIENVLYAFVLVFCVNITYLLINKLLLVITMRRDVVLFAMEPISFGLFFLLYDLAFIRLKKFFKKIIDDAKKKVKGGV